MTPQRRVILEQLRATTKHPTADELYTSVRQRVPSISLGTVYRNLELLAQQGFVRKIEVGGTQRRYDADTSLHYHVRCLVCVKVDDVWIDPRRDLERECASATHYDIGWHHVEFAGVCPECAAAGHSVAELPFTAGNEG
jgi:Fur family transcriptional regulator, ferric uptake regulator